MAQQNFPEFEFQEDRQSQIVYPKKAMMRRSAASSINSADVRNGRHGVMTKCELLAYLSTSQMQTLTLN